MNLLQKFEIIQISILDLNASAFTREGWDMRTGRSTAIICTVLLIAVTLSIFNASGAEPPVKGPEIKTGHITADETWEMDYAIRDLVIDEGVTVTVDAG